MYSLKHLLQNHLSFTRISIISFQMFALGLLWLLIFLYKLLHKLMLIFSVFSHKQKLFKLENKILGNLSVYNICVQNKSSKKEAEQTFSSTFENVNVMLCTYVAVMIVHKMFSKIWHIYLCWYLTLTMCIFVYCYPMTNMHKF